MPQHARASGKGGRFLTTEWSLVLAAGDSENPDSRAAPASLRGDPEFEELVPELEARARPREATSPP
jgi:hypothetical protein